MPPSCLAFWSQEQRSGQGFHRAFQLGQGKMGSLGLGAARILRELELEPGSGAFPEGVHRHGSSAVTLLSWLS